MSKDSESAPGMRSRHIFGCGKLAELENIVREFSPGKIMLVTGRKSYERTGLKFRMEKMLGKYETFRYWDFSPNPNPEELIMGSGKLRDFKPDLVIALGGGSVMDTAKLITVLPPEENKAEKIIKGEKKVPKRKIPLILVPTTAGTGSECTHFAVVYDGKKKYSVADEGLLPDCSLSDPELTAAMPEKTAAVSAFDAFCQAVESYWAIGSNKKSRVRASEAIKLFNEYFLSFVKKRDRRSCEKMMIAAHLSGKAINISKTTGAHALSYILTINYGIPHGYAVILTLPEFFVFNAAASENQLNSGISFSRHRQNMKELCSLMEAKAPREAAEKIRQKVRDAGFATRLSQAGVKNKKDIRKITDNVNLERLKNNPAKITKKQIKKMLKKIW